MKELRDWIQLAFVVVGGVVALIAYFQNLRQRRVENALKFLGLFRDGLQEGDLVEFTKLLRASSESAGVEAGQYASERGHTASVGDYFSEGSEDNRAISRMAQSLDVVCHQVLSGAADARTVYYELGQLISFMNYQLSAVKDPTSQKPNFLEYAFPSIASFCKKYEKEIPIWPSRTYAYIE
jgi:hypothetical protein